jgi:hypothetical protein
MGFGEKDIANILTGVNQGVNNYVSMQDKMLEHEQRAEKLKKEKDLEEFTDSSVGAMKALYGVESVMGDPAFQGDVTTQAKGFLDFYNKDVPNGRQYTGASIARGQDGKGVLMLTEQDDQGNTRQVPADTRKLIRNTALTYSMKTGKALHDDADKYEQQTKMERLRQDNRMDILQARLDGKSEQGSGKQADVEFLIRSGVPQQEAIRRVFGHDPANPRDYSDKQHAEMTATLVKQGYTLQEATTMADEYIATRQTKPQPGAAPQVVTAPPPPAPAPAPTGKGGAVGAAAGGMAQPPAAGAAPPSAGKPLDANTAKAYLAKSGGDKAAARAAARADGYTF